VALTVDRKAQEHRYGGCYKKGNKADSEGGYRIEEAAAGCCGRGAETNLHGACVRTNLMSCRQCSAHCFAAATRRFHQLARACFVQWYFCVRAHFTFTSIQSINGQRLKATIGFFYKTGPNAKFAYARLGGANNFWMNLRPPSQVLRLRCIVLILLICTTVCYVSSVSYASRGDTLPQWQWVSGRWRAVLIIQTRIRSNDDVDGRQVLAIRCCSLHRCRWQCSLVSALLHTVRQARHTGKSDVSTVIVLVHNDHSSLLLLCRSTTH